MKIKVIIPNSGMDTDTLHAREEMLSKYVCRGTEVSVSCIAHGPVSIESNTDEVLAGVFVLKDCIRAERDGFDAVIIYCFSDLAIDAVRENVNIPVIGPGEETLGAACRLSNRFAVVTTTQANVPRTTRRLMKDREVAVKMTSVRPLNIPVEELRTNPDAEMQYLETIAQEAIREEGIDGLVLGCLGMARYGAVIEEKFGIKVFDPASIAASAAQAYICSGTVHSRAAYPRYEKGELYGL